LQVAWWARRRRRLPLSRPAAPPILRTGQQRSVPPACRVDDVFAGVSISNNRRERAIVARTKALPSRRSLHVLLPLPGCILDYTDVSDGAGFRALYESLVRLHGCIGHDDGNCSDEVVDYLYADLARGHCRGMPDPRRRCHQKRQYRRWRSQSLHDAKPLKAVTGLRCS